MKQMSNTIKKIKKKIKNDGEKKLKYIQLSQLLKSRHFK